MARENGKIIALASKGRLLTAWIELLVDEFTGELFFEDGEGFELKAEDKSKICKM